MGLMIFMSIWSIRLAVLKFYSKTAIINEQTLFEYLKRTPEFRDLVVSVSATYLCYLLSSILHGDPWHIFTSMIQYMFLLPTYSIIFLIYSFCNLHDVSWGTKGSLTNNDTAPAAKVVNTDGTATYEYVSVEQDDINEDWKNNLKKMLQLKEQKEDGNSKRDVKTKQEDECKSFRTKVVLFWVLCNTALIVFFTNDASLKEFFPLNTGAVNPYITFLFWSFSGLSAFRFLGSFVYMLQWWGENLSYCGGSDIELE
jgi:chitin synthase